jgi:hypothetical protein
MYALPLPHQIEIMILGLSYIINLAALLHIIVVVVESSMM